MTSLSSRTGRILSLVGSLTVGVLLSTTTAAGAQGSPTGQRPPRPTTTTTATTVAPKSPNLAMTCGPWSSGAGPANDMTLTATLKADNTVTNVKVWQNYQLVNNTYVYQPTVIASTAKPRLIHVRGWNAWVVTELPSLANVTVAPTSNKYLAFQVPDAHPLAPGTFATQMADLTYTAAVDAAGYYYWASNTGSSFWNTCSI
jgi:hypothetical protein